jgi:hypothetical protein
MAVLQNRVTAVNRHGRLSHDLSTGFRARPYGFFIFICARVVCGLSCDVQRGLLLVSVSGHIVNGIRMIPARESPQEIRPFNDIVVRTSAPHSCTLSIHRTAVVCSRRSRAACDKRGPLSTGACVRISFSGRQRTDLRPHSQEAARETYLKELTPLQHICDGGRLGTA